MIPEERAFRKLILAYESDESKELTVKDEAILDRWRFAHNVITNDFKIGSAAEEAIMAEFGVSRHTARKDMYNARQYFLTDDKIDKPFWRYILSIWQLKGIALAYQNDNIREFNSGIKNLYLIMGLDHPDSKLHDPKLFQQNIYNFFSDPKKVGIEPVTDKEIMDLINSFKDITESERTKLFADAQVEESEQSD
jgi:hypothetical protein